METQQTANRVISSHDVIVVGGGLGGLGAACQLALAGVNVLLLEKHNVPGGFATSFVRGRFEFEGALHELSSIGTKENPGGLYRFFEEIGLVPDKLTFLQVPEMYRSVFLDGYAITMPFDEGAYIEKLIAEFPAEAQGIRDYFAMCQAVGRGMDYVASKEGKINPLAILFKHPWLARAAGLTAGDLIGRYLKNSRLIAIATQLWGYFGLPPSQVNAIYFIAAMESFFKHGAAFPRGRSHALTSAIINCFEALGGKAKFNTLVNRILVENGRVVGVELLNGEIYRSKAVISNVNPICTTLKMLPPNVVTEKEKRRVLAPEIGCSAFSVYLGLNAPAGKLGITCHENFINETDDNDEIYRAFSELRPPKTIVAACYNTVDPTISPPDTTELVLTTLQLGKVWHSVAPDQYHRIKDYIADGMIQLVEKTICPNLRDHIEVAEVATPLTYYRYSKNMDGAIYGYRQGVLDSPMLRLNSRGAIPGLYNAGAWTNLGGGYEPCISSGRMAAAMCLKDLNREGK